LFAVITPYLLFIKHVTGTWQLSTKTAILLQYARVKTADGNLAAETKFTSKPAEDGQTFEIDRAEETLGSFLLHHPREAMQRVVMNSLHLLRQKGITFGWTAVLLFFWFLATRGKTGLHHKTAFILMHLSPILFFLFFYIDSRFLLAFIPFIGIGIARVGEDLFVMARTLGEEGRTYTIASVILLFVAMGGIVYGPRAVRLLEKRERTGQALPLEHKWMGNWMRTHLTILPTTKIMHRNPWVSFYAGGCHTRTPDVADLRQLVEWCVYHDVKYLIIDERMMKPNYPSLAFLLDESKNHNGLRRVKTGVGIYPKIVLYALEPSFRDDQ
jgi:hypothetical protein